MAPKYFSEAAARMLLYRLLCVASLFVGMRTASAEDRQLPGEQVSANSGVDQFLESAEGPYCGINSLSACLEVLGVQVPPAELASKDYVGSDFGSTAEELVRAAEECGAKAVFMEGLTAYELQELRVPAILHTRTLASREYNHWIAFLGGDLHNTRLLDAPHPVYDASTAELLTEWDGKAVVVFSEGSAAPRFRSALAWRALNCLGWGAIAVTSIVLASRIAEGRFFSCIPRTAGELSLIFMAAIATSVAYHSYSPIGFLRNPNAVKEIERSTLPIASVEEVRYERVEELRSLLDDAALIDARLASDYMAGHIPGAMSMPVNLPVWARRSMVENLSRKTCVIVYCQSEGCLYSDRIAEFLLSRNVPHVRIYRGGYRDWVDRNAAQNLNRARKN